MHRAESSCAAVLQTAFCEEQLAALAGRAVEPAKALHRQNIYFHVAALPSWASRVALSSESNRNKEGSNWNKEGSNWNKEGFKLKKGGIKGWGRCSDVLLGVSWCRWPTTARRPARLERRRRTTKGTMRTRSACPSSSSSQRRGGQEESWRRREQDWEISSVHQWTNAVVQCVLYLFAVSWAMSCWSLLFWTQVPFSSSAVFRHFCVIPGFPVGVPRIFLFLFESLINLLCNFRWASFSCKFQHPA